MTTRKELKAVNTLDFEEQKLTYDSLRNMWTQPTARDYYAHRLQEAVASAHQATDKNEQRRYLSQARLMLAFLSLTTLDVAAKEPKKRRSTARPVTDPQPESAALKPSDH